MIKLTQTLRPLVVTGVIGFPLLGWALAFADDPNGVEVAMETDSKPRVISFNNDVRPIISDKCFHCHGPDAENQESDFRLDTEEHALADLGGYAGIVPGDIEASELVVRIHITDDDDAVMPPADAARQLAAAEKETLEMWIKQGAPFEAHWAFESVPKETSVPESGSPWIQSPIDEFVIETANKNGFANLFPNVAATPEKWLRRITFDLTGLPPTLKEIDDFLNDDSTTARHRVIDRLLASDASAERLASEWLDVARYSDSYGYQRDDERYVWPYRDWVIDAFKENKPYDEFVIEQLAGDLLEQPTRDQILATAFNRLHSHKKEGGVAIEEFRVENVADRNHTFSAAFMGLTMECARCHDHKYDPIKTKEYYQLTAFFGNIEENGLISYFTDATPTPALSLPTPDQDQQLKQAAENVESAKRALDQRIADGSSDFSEWLGKRQSLESLPGLVAQLSFEEMTEFGKDDKRLAETGKKLPKKQAARVRHMVNDVVGSAKVITSNVNTFVDGVDGKALRLSGDDAVVIPGVAHFRRHDAFSFALWIKPAELDQRGVIYRRSRGWDDAGSVGYELTKEDGRLSAKFVHFWPGNAICVETDEILQKDQWHHVAVTYDGSSKAAGVKIFVDGKSSGSNIVHDSLTRDIFNWRLGFNDFAIGARFRDRGFKDGAVDNFYAFDRVLTDAEIAQLQRGAESDGGINMLLKKSVDEMADEDKEQLRAFYFSAVDSSAQDLREKLKLARLQWNKVMDEIPSITVMREQAQPRETFLLERGGYDNRGEKVTAETPAFLPPFPEGQPRNRLGLARWLLDDEHPLTARVVVNRYWQLLFGNGLVRTPEDFGLQGQTPTHPQLLDWLARDLMDHDWDVRRLIKQIALSSTYLQSSVVSKDVRNKDPENRFYTRGPSQRLSAEMVRDNALAISGLLVEQVGGPPVKPYDVALAYTPMDVDKGEGLYRRSLYTFWKRTSPAPVMITMNANKREVCRLKREISASPLQALVLLNGPQFVEAAKVLAGKLLHEHPEDISAMSTQAFRTLTSRSPKEKEIDVMKQLYEEQLAHYSDHQDMAKEMLTTGDTPPDETLPAEKLAAATVLVNALMNLDESVRNK